MAKYTLNIGQELHSDTLIYRIESVLGQGSFGITYKAKAFTVIKGKFGEELVETNTPKAIKEFFMKEVNEREESGSITRMSEGGLTYNYAQKFKKEAENLASMNHPNIVKVIDFISANNTYYYVMDFIEGENLNDYLKNKDSDWLKLLSQRCMKRGLAPLKIFLKRPTGSNWQIVISKNRNSNNRLS